MSPNPKNDDDHTVLIDDKDMVSDDCSVLSEAIEEVTFYHNFFTLSPPVIFRVLPQKMKVKRFL